MQNQSTNAQMFDKVLQGYIFILLTLLTLYPALLAGGYVGYLILFHSQLLPWDALIAQVVVISIGFFSGVGILGYGIKTIPNRWLLRLARMAAVLSMAGMLVFYIKMVSKLALENYTLFKFSLHIAMLVVIAFVVLLLDRLHPVPLRQYYLVPLLMGALMHFLSMLVHYVAAVPQEPWHVLEDLTLFAIVLAICMAFSGHLVEALNFLAYKVTKTIVEA